MKFTSYYVESLLKESFDQENYNRVQRREVLPYFSDIYGHGQDVNEFVIKRPQVFTIIAKTFRKVVEAADGIDETGKPNSDSEKWNSESVEHAKFIKMINSLILQNLKSKGLAPEASIAVNS